ncbi:MAG: hypothetical protein A2Y21_04170 [Clostridiales bacterium GWC2_40_7]|nr:MAG: hypothetical protein A2Y21_04170 [Clostridiales bacterium GWC2_40_7]
MYTIKYFANTTAVKTSAEQEIGKIIKDRFGIVLEYVPFTGDYREKCNLMLASGDYPDLVRMEREDIVQKYISAGALVPLDDYLKDAPNFTERYKDVIPYWRLSSNDKKLYKWESSVPVSGTLVEQTNHMIIRTDALEKEGWPKLLSEDDYYNFFKKTMQDIPTSNGKKTIGLTMPLGESWGTAGILGIMFEKGDEYNAAGGNEGVIFNIKTKKYEDYITNKYVKEGLQFFNRLYRDGLFDKECFTDKMGQTVVKMNEGTALGVWYCGWLVRNANNFLIKAGHPEMQYISLPVQSNTMVQQGQKQQIQVEFVRSFDSVGITKNAKDPARLFKLVDFFASEEGQILQQSGIEGQDYTIKDGKRVPTDTYMKMNRGELEDKSYSEKEGLQSFILFSHCLVLGKDGVAYDMIADPTIRDAGKTDRTKEAFKKLGWANASEWWVKNGVDDPLGIVPSIMIDPSSDIGSLYQKMTELRVKTMPKLVMAKSDSDFENIYKNMVDEYNKLPHQKAVDKFNEMYNAAMNKLK